MSACLPPPDVPTEPADEPPDPVTVVQCAGCGAVGDHPAPPGWVVARPAGGRTQPYQYGACPACVAGLYTFPAGQPLADTVVVPPQVASTGPTIRVGLHP